MIELTNKTKQDFLDRKWVQKLLDAGVDMNDAKYCIVYDEDGNDAVELVSVAESEAWMYTPTYTISELLYKLHEWIYPVIGNVQYLGGFHFIKDAPFYIAYYNLRNPLGKEKDDYIHSAYEYPIESLASLLIQCHEKGIGSVNNISDK